jgi:hypothetical protein
MIVASSSVDKTKTPGGSRFLNVVLLVRWSNKLVKNMFQYQLAFINDINLLSIASMAFSMSSILQLPLKLVSCLVTLVDFCSGYDLS